MDEAYQVHLIPQEVAVALKAGSVESATWSNILLFNSHKINLKFMVLANTDRFLCVIY